MNKVFVALTFLALALCSCASYQEIQLTDVQFKNLDTGDKFRATFDVEIDNPNSFPVRLSKPRLKVFIGDLELKDWSVSQKIKLKRKTKQTYPFYVEISGVEAMKILPRLLMHPELRIEGTVKAGTFIFGKRIPLEIKEKLY